ncbi:hypothetical protein ACCI51_18650 [Microbulbifer echini]|uniref:Uncharacterized protein n=2 Tax=Microbulbifer TaxID=48073 RepID=A0ABV4NSZ5_9GAMM
MSQKVKIEHILERKPVGIFVRVLDDTKFELGDNPALAGCPIKKSVTQPRALKKDGSPDLDVFCFYLVNGNDKSKFKVGEVVELVP